MIIKAKNLVKHYGIFKKFEAVRGVNLNVKEGSIYGLLGHNGAGKTTTFGMLTTLIRPTSGDAIVCGHSILKEPEKIKKKIGILPQNSNFYPNRTGFDNLVYYARLAGMSKPEARKEVDELLGRVGLDEKKHVKTKNYSHGMIKLAAIAHALIGKPEIVFLDEPLAGLDPQVVHKIREVIKSLKKESTVVFSSHNLDEVERVCDTVGIMHRGRVVAEDKITKIKRIKNVLTFKITNITDSMIKSLQAVKDVKDVKKVDSTVVVTFKGKKDMTQKVLANLTKSKADVTEIFKGKNLEEVFMESLG